MKDKLYQMVPRFLQEVMISVFNYTAYRVRYGRKYKEFRQLFLENRTLTRIALKEMQAKRLDTF